MNPESTTVAAGPSSTVLDSDASTDADPADHSAADPAAHSGEIGSAEGSRDHLEGDRRRIRLRWWLEVGYVLAFYTVYTAVRNQFGSGGRFSVGAERALSNAEWVIHIEKSLGLFFESSLQALFLGQAWFIRIWNVFYGSLHFVVTGAVMVYLYRHFPTRYRRYRTILAATTGLALLGFALVPLMPPRLLGAGPPFGGSRVQYGFVDTLSKVGALWSFDSGTMQKISNQWAAMPSLHIGWSMWCALALYPVLVRRWARILVIIYPMLTLFAIIVTANHYWFDALGGAVVLGVGWFVGTHLTSRIPARPLVTLPD
ncbi:MAG TPA: phosphatase PAP2 family protein [Acidimicrobiales bacterium]|nr:phosphatase PAP2 family protein [Acidimicrobiales bacterium]